MDQPDRDDYLRGIFERVSNCGRWGDDDELGTLNFITAEKRVTAAKLVEAGKVVSVGRDLSTEADAVNFWPIQHLMVAEHAGIGPAYDFVGINPHGFAVTHLDAITHSNWNGRVYNGRTISEIQTRTGLTFGSIFAQREGIFTRGVLLDVASCRGVSALPPDAGITVADLEAAERMAAVRVGSGDVLLLRMGLRVWEADNGVQAVDRRAGLLPECLEWFHEREIAVYGGDCIERIPSASSEFRLPLHHIGMPSMGLVLLDWPEVEELAMTCIAFRRWEFLFTVAPMRLDGATGAAVNPLCIF